MERQCGLFGLAGIGGGADRGGTGYGGADGAAALELLPVAWLGAGGGEHRFLPAHRYLRFESVCRFHCG